MKFSKNPSDSEPTVSFVRQNDEPQPAATASVGRGVSGWAARLLRSLGFESSGGVTSFGVKEGTDLTLSSDAKRLMEWVESASDLRKDEYRELANQLIEDSVPIGKLAVPERDPPDGSQCYPRPEVPFADPRYQLLKRLGGGSFGVVYSAEDDVTHREVALKIFPPDVGSAGEFLSEARAVANLKHSNIATLFDVGQTPNGQWYLVQELIQGPNLRDLFKVAPRVNFQLVAELFGRIAGALDHAHRAGFVHRDISQRTCSSKKCDITYGALMGVGSDRLAKS